MKGVDWKYNYFYMSLCTLGIGTRVLSRQTLFIYLFLSLGMGRLGWLILGEDGLACIMNAPSVWTLHHLFKYVACSLVYNISYLLCLNFFFFLYIFRNYLPTFHLHPLSFQISYVCLII